MSNGDETHFINNLEPDELVGLLVSGEILARRDERGPLARQWVCRGGHINQNKEKPMAAVDQKDE